MAAAIDADAATAMPETTSSRIPRELIEFFTTEGGHSLVIRGTAGAGKTTLALQIIEDLAAIESSFYYSTRVSDVSLFTQFPWLKGRMAGAVPEPSKDKVRDELASLKGVAPAKRSMGKGLVSVNIGRDLGEIDRLYAEVENRASGRTLLVIDSLDALAEKYSLTPMRLLVTLQKDLVEGKQANIVFVLESPEMMLDYLGDGVVRLAMEEHAGRRIRVLELLKLRGCEIRQPKYLCTLRGGKINSFEYGPGKTSLRNGPWAPIQDAGDRISTGISDLDSILGAGIERGSVVLIELGEGVPIPVAGAIEEALVTNFVGMGRGVIWMPLRKVSGEAARARLAEAIPQDRFESKVRIPELAAAMTNSGSKFVLPVEGTSAASDLKWQNMTYHLSGGEQPYLTLLGFDTAESIYGPQVMEQLADHIAAVKRNRSVFVAMTSPSNASAARLKDIATIHLKLDRIGGTVLIYGDEPYTECNAITFKEQEQ
ncbi:MAG TPA: gas vesicle protein GvpD P-loop domain-containing protein, partial [Methanomassiliicoccales archaeon]|nr:gas vesicle protein GvpD P-loop domain-containing protein [Methanomassiliicoccales archaeon]